MEVDSGALAEVEYDARRRLLRLRLTRDEQNRYFDVAPEAHDAPMYPAPTSGLFKRMFPAITVASGSEPVLPQEINSRDNPLFDPSGSHAAPRLRRALSHFAAPLPSGGKTDLKLV